MVKYFNLLYLFVFSVIDDLEMKIPLYVLTLNIFQLHLGVWTSCRTTCFVGSFFFPFKNKLVTYLILFVLEFPAILQGVLIVGERGTGKTSLALAIAAEARVPVVKVEAQQLEPGLWVGQSASNVRELFQTARDLVAL